MARQRLTPYQMEQITNNTRMREAAMNPTPFVNTGRYGITFPAIMATMIKVMNATPIEFPNQNASRSLWVADGIDAQAFAKYSIGEIQILVSGEYLAKEFDDFPYEMLQVNNRITMVIFKQSLIDERISKQSRVANLYNICKGLVALYKMDGLDSFWGSIYMNTIITAPLCLTCKVWNKIYKEPLVLDDFGDSSKYQENELFFLSDKVLDIINDYSEEYLFNFGILNDQV